jgi:hypothetical protein
MPRQTRERPWVIIFVLLSLLAHLLFVLTILVISHLIPTPKLKSPPQQITSLTLSLQQPPPPAPPHHRIFALSKPDQSKPTQQPIESDNDSALHSQSTAARNPDSLMPDLVRKQEHASAMEDSPNAPSKTPPRPGNPSSATAAQQQQKTAQQNATKPSPQNQPTPQQAQQPSKTDSKQTKTTNQKTATPIIVQQQLDANGLPVLPPISAPTMAPASERQETPPASSEPEIAQDSHGALGTHGDTSPAAMATELGRYKAKVYRTVGGRWYPAVDRQFQILPVGVVHIQFTIHSDGSVDTKVLDGDNGSMQILLTISLEAIRESAPFDPFTPSMIKEVGDSYTDDFSFSIYGQ